MAAEADRLSVAVIMEQASYIFPSSEPGRLNLQASSELVTMLNWAMSPHVKRLNMAFVLVDEKLADVSDRLAGSPHVATLEVPLPSEDDRARFIEASWTLDTVVGHEAAKARLREDAKLLKRGALDSLPMGYLLCGPVGTGKSFMAQCLSGEIGIPCVILKNFRSKYVGETEGNLQHVLSVLRAMGPVVVVVDEADAALGSREAEGDSGTSSRVFGMIAAQMGDTQYRGRIIWMLLTARPDLLPIDLKRQGRAEVDIPVC